MKNKVFLLLMTLSLAISFSLTTCIAFADDSRSALTITEATFNMDDPDQPPEENGVPFEKWCKLTLSDGTEATLLTDGSINNEIVDEEGERLKNESSLEAIALNCWLSTPVKRDEVVKFSSPDEYEWNGETQFYSFLSYAVKGNLFNNMQYPVGSSLSVSNDYVLSLNATILDPNMYMPSKVALMEYDDNPNNSPDFIYVHFEFGLEEQEVIDAIAVLPEAESVKLTDESAIKAARTLYDGLAKWKTTEPADPDIQNKVTNYSKLEDCESAISALKAEEIAKQNAIKDANTAISTTNALSASNYTEASFKAVTDAKATLETLLAKTDATSTEIIQATNALNDAIGKLLKKTPTVVKKAQPMTVKAVLKAVSFKALKKAKKVVKGAIVVKKNQGTVTYKKLSGSKKLTINKTTGKVTVKKGTKKGLYKIKVKVTAKGNAKYKAGSKIVTVKIRVK